MEEQILWREFGRHNIPPIVLLFGIVLWMDCYDQVGVTYNVRLNLLANTQALYVPPV